MNVVTKPNPELAAALSNSQVSIDYRDYLEGQIQHIAELAKQDLFCYRCTDYSRQVYTTALLLSADSQLRMLAKDKGIDLKAFDNIIGQTQQLIIDLTRKPIPGVKVATVLRRHVGI